jgi:hypothetical protein
LAQAGEMRLTAAADRAEIGECWAPCAGGHWRWRKCVVCVCGGGGGGAGAKRKNTQNTKHDDTCEWVMSITVYCWRGIYIYAYM